MAKTALITGAGKGIGLEIALQLSAIGYQVILSGRHAESMIDASECFLARGLDPHILFMDVSDPGSIRKAAEKFGETHTKLDVLINNAAILQKEDQSILQNGIGVHEQTLRTNAYGPLWVTQAFLPYMRKPGKVIMISSGGGSMTDPVGGWSPSYCVSKTLLNSITRQLAHELEGKKISVNAVCPGWVRTAMGGAAAPRSVQQGAETSVWLASEADPGVTGKFFRDKKVIPW